MDRRTHPETEQYIAVAIISETNLEATFTIDVLHPSQPANKKKAKQEKEKKRKSCV